MCHREYADSEEPNQSAHPRLRCLQYHLMLKILITSIKGTDQTGRGDLFPLYVLFILSICNYNYSMYLLNCCASAWRQKAMHFFMRPNKKIGVFRVTLPYLIFLLKPCNCFPVFSKKSIYAKHSDKKG